MHRCKICSESYLDSESLVDHQLANHTPEALEAFNISRKSSESRMVKDWQSRSTENKSSILKKLGYTPQDIQTLVGLEYNQLGNKLQGEVGESLVKTKEITQEVKLVETDENKTYQNMYDSYLQARSAQIKRPFQDGTESKASEEEDHEDHFEDTLDDHDASDIADVDNKKEFFDDLTHESKANEFGQTWSDELDDWVRYEFEPTDKYDLEYLKKEGRASGITDSDNAWQDFWDDWGVQDGMSMNTHLNGESKASELTDDEFNAYQKKTEDDFMNDPEVGSDNKTNKQRFDTLMASLKAEGIEPPKASETQDDFDWLNEDDDRFTATMWEQSDGSWLVKSEGSQFDSSFTKRFTDSVDANIYMDKVNRGELTKQDLYNDEMNGYRSLESKASELGHNPPVGDDGFDQIDEEEEDMMHKLFDTQSTGEAKVNEYGEFDLPSQDGDYIAGWSELYDVTKDQMYSMYVNTMKESLEKYLINQDLNQAKYLLGNWTQNTAIFDLPSSKRNTQDGIDAFNSAKQNIEQWLREQEQSQNGTLPDPSWESKATEEDHDGTVWSDFYGKWIDEDVAKKDRQARGFQESIPNSELLLGEVLKSHTDYHKLINSTLSGEFSIPCSKCSKKFKAQESLDVHYNDYHTDLELKSLIGELNTNEAVGLSKDWDEEEKGRSGDKPQVEDEPDDTLEDARNQMQKDKADGEPAEWQVGGEVDDETELNKAHFQMLSDKRELAGLGDYNPNDSEDAKRVGLGWQEGEENQDDESLSEEEELQRARENLKPLEDNLDPRSNLTKAFESGASISDIYSKVGDKSEDIGGEDDLNDIYNNVNVKLNLEKY